MTIGQDVKAIWVASVARTGSMWTYNIIRDLLRAAGYAVRPDIVPQTDAEMVGVGMAGAVNTVGEVYVLKMHGMLKSLVANSHYVITHRDIRDGMMSFMRFQKLTFEEGLAFIDQALAFESYSRSFPANHRSDVEYDDIVEYPTDVATHLAEDLGITLPPAAIEEVVGHYTKQAVAARIDAAERRVAAKINSRLSVSMGEVVVGPRDIARAYDPATGFQSGHVSNYRPGDWQDVLFPSQKRRLAECIAAAQRKYGLA